MINYRSMDGTRHQVYEPGDEVWIKNESKDLIVYVVKPSGALNIADLGDPDEVARTRSSSGRSPEEPA